VYQTIHCIFVFIVNIEYTASSYKLRMFHIHFKVILKIYNIQIVILYLKLTIWQQICRILKLNVPMIEINIIFFESF